MITGWYNDDYLLEADGGMSEGFMSYWSDDERLTGEDWPLSARRILKYLTAANKILLAQTTLDPNNITARHWAVANFLLLRNQTSFYVIATDEVTWFPEYEIDLGDYLSEPPATLEELQVAGQSELYRRDYRNGVVLVNNSGSSRSASLPSGSFNTLTFAGGGVVSGNSKPTIQLIETAVEGSTISVPAYTARILKKRS